MNLVLCRIWLLALFTLGLLTGCSRPTSVEAAPARSLSPVTRTSETHESGGGPTDRPKPSAHDDLIVLELFTSEGCSSCPPADRLLKRLSDQDAGLLTLSFHVDYWNDLGWADPYSSPKYSRRQRWYAQTSGRRGVFTPELIVQGQKSVVASRKQAVHDAVRSTNGGSPRVELQLETSADSASYRLSGTFAKATLNLAVLQHNAAQRVTRGENTGHQLNHRNVVRQFERHPIHASQKTSAPQTAHWPLAIPEDADRGLSVAAYLQRRSDQVILAATRVKLPTR